MTPRSAHGLVLMLAVGGCAKASPTMMDRARQVLRDEGPARSGALLLRCIPEDADVALDGVPQGTCADYAHGRGLTMGSGLHRLEVTKDGHHPHQTYVEPSGVRASLSITLAKAPGEGPVQ